MQASGNRSRRWMFAIGVLLLAAFALFAGITLALQGGFGRAKLASILTDAVQESGWSADIETTQGSLFETLLFSGIVLTSPEGDKLTIGSLEMQLSLWQLFKREIAVDTLHADKVSWTRTPTNIPSSTTTASTGLPYKLAIKQFSLTNVQLPYSEMLAECSGKFSLGKHNRSVLLTLKAKRLDVEDSRAKLVFQMKAGQVTQLRVDLNAPTLELFAPWIHLPVEGNATIHCFVQGPWSNLSSLLTRVEPTGSLHGFVRASGDVTKAPSSFLERHWSFYTSFERTDQQELLCKEILLKSAGEEISGQVKLAKDGSLLASSLQGKIQQFPFALNGSLLVGFNMPDPNHATLRVSSSELSYEDIQINNSEATFQAVNTDGVWTGALDAHGMAFHQEWSAKSDLQLDPTLLLHIERFSLDAPFLTAQGDVQLSPSFPPRGEIAAEIPNLNNFPWPLYGKAKTTVRWKEGGTEFDATLRNVYYKQIHVDEIAFFANLSDHATLSLERIVWESISIDSLAIETANNGENWSFEMAAEGDWKGPLALKGEGYWQEFNGKFLADLQDMTGTIFFRPLALAAPAQFEIGMDLYRLSDVKIELGNASLEASLSKDPQTTRAHLLMGRFPIDFLSINPLELSVIGTVDLKAELFEQGGAISGSLNMEVNDVEIATIADEHPVNGKFLLTANLANEQLSMNSELWVRDQSILKAQSQLPVHVNLFPFDAHFLSTPKASAELFFDGPIEELLDFFDLGPNRLEGHASAHFKLSNNLQRPWITGSGRLENGVYENYYTGMQLQSIQASLAADGSSIVLRSLTAKDSVNKGKFSLHGEIAMLFEQNFPFSFDGEFSRFNIAETEWITTEAAGTIHLSGNSHSARATGQVAVLETDLSIPGKLPSSLPDLQVKYINAPKPLPIAELTKPVKKGYPLFLDLHIYAPNGVFVSGRGLNSEWKGDFQLGGTYTDIEARGKLELLLGEFVFSGKGFKLSEGTLTFSGKPHEMPLINLAARMPLQTVEIIARMQGPINAPQLSFQSIPPLPLGSVLSYLLFGEDLSEINAIQAAQLVNSISSLASESGPSVLETTRRSLGVDRLRIIAQPSSDEGAQTMALQVGKYVTRGVLVSVSQGAAGDSTNLSVEVDLVNGFVFQAESRQEQQQGKFTVKWSLNY